MPSNNQSYVEVEDIETGERVVSASNSHSSTRRAGDGAMLHAEATVVVSDELREETKKRDAEMLLMQAKLASKNLGETLRKKAESENVIKTFLARLLADTLFKYIFNTQKEKSSLHIIRFHGHSECEALQLQRT